MNKLLTAAVAVVLGTASAASFADSGNFFVNGNLGQTNWRDDNAARAFDGVPGITGVNQDNNGVAGQLRVGYRWRSVVDYGVELGYGYLGENTVRISNADGTTDHLKQKSRGYLLGGNLNWNITDQWYISGRAGWYRGRNTIQGREDGGVAGSVRLASATDTETGEYMGLGVGYNINQHFSVGLNFDHFRMPGKDGADATKANMTTVGGEFRF